MFSLFSVSLMPHVVYVSLPILPHLFMFGPVRQQLLYFSESYHHCVLISLNVILNPLYTAARGASGYWTHLGDSESAGGAP